MGRSRGQSRAPRPTSRPCTARDGLAECDHRHRKVERTGRFSLRARLAPKCGSRADRAPGYSGWRRAACRRAPGKFRDACADLPAPRAGFRCRTPPDRRAARARCECHWLRYSAARAGRRTRTHAPDRGPIVVEKAGPFAQIGAQRIERGTFELTECNPDGGEHRRQRDQNVSRQQTPQQPTFWHGYSLKR